MYTIQKHSKAILDEGNEKDWIGDKLRFLELDVPLGGKH